MSQALAPRSIAVLPSTDSRLTTDPPSARITVAEALALPVLRRGLPGVVAGHGRLDTPIRWVHAGEVPNIAKLLRGGELLLTTGMGIGAGAGDQRRFVADLAGKGVAAVAIELGRAFPALPPALVAAALEHDLPLVELRREVPFVGVTEAVHTAIVNQHYDLLRRGEDLQRRFSALIVRGGGIPDLLGLLAEVIGNPVFLEAGDGRLLFHAAPGSSQAEDDPVGAWARAADAGASVAVDAPTGLAAGRLLALPTDAPLASFTEMALERAAAVVALALLRDREEGALEARGRGDLLAAVARGAIAPARAAEHARAMGFAPHGTALLPIAARLHGGCLGGWGRALAELERDLGALGVPVLAGVARDGDALLLVIGVGDDGTRRPAVAERVAAVLHACALRRHDAAAVVAVGPVADWAALGAGLAETIDSAAAALGLPPRAWHDATRMPLDRLLWRWRDAGELALYVERLLGPLAAYDAARRSSLLATLEALCRHGGRKAETARALHLNRQALYDRIARIEQVLGVDTSDPDALLELQLALRARLVTAGTQPVG